MQMSGALGGGKATPPPSKEELEAAKAAYKAAGHSVTILPAEVAPRRPSTGRAERASQAALLKEVGSVKKDGELPPELREELASVYGGVGSYVGGAPSSRRKRGLVRGDKGGFVSYPV